MASCLSCCHLRSVGPDPDGRPGYHQVRCDLDATETIFITGLEWKTLNPSLKIACNSHARYCAQCGVKLEGLAASRSNYCDRCKPWAKKFRNGIISIEEYMEATLGKES